MENRYCVIMGGGIGSRFWPFSRNNRPKQFLDFFGIGRSLLQMSYDRFIKIIPKDHIFIVKYSSLYCLGLLSYSGTQPECQYRCSPFGSSHSQRRRIRSMRQSRARFRIKISGTAHLRHKAQSS